MGEHCQNDYGKQARYTASVVYLRKGNDPVHLTLTNLTLSELAENLGFLDDDFQVLTMCLSADPQNYPLNA